MRGRKKAAVSDRHVVRMTTQFTEAEAREIEEYVRGIGEAFATWARRELLKSARG